MLQTVSCVSAAADAGWRAGADGINALHDGSVTRYVSAGGVTDWTAIKTVRVTFTFVNPLAGQPGQPGTIAATRVINLSGQGQS